MAAPKPRTSCFVEPGSRTMAPGACAAGFHPGPSALAWRCLRSVLHMRIADGDSPHAVTRLARETAAAEAAADLRKLLRERFAIHAPCSWMMEDARMIPAPEDSSKTFAQESRASGAP